MAKLVYNDGNFTKSIQCIDESDLYIPKPYIKVNGSAMLPLTTNTSSGIKVQVDGVQYSPITNIISTTKTTVTQTIYGYNYDIGSTKSTSQTYSISDKEFGIGGNGAISERQFRKTYTELAHTFYTYSNLSSTITKLGYYTYSTFTQDQDDYATWSKTDGWVALGGAGGYFANVSNQTIVNGDYKNAAFFYYKNTSIPMIHHGALYHGHNYTNNPFILISASSSSSQYGNLARKSVLSYSSSYDDTFKSTWAVNWFDYETRRTGTDNEVRWTYNQALYFINTNTKNSALTMSTSGYTERLSVSATYMNYMTQGITCYGPITNYSQDNNGITYRMVTNTNNTNLSGAVYSIGTITSMNLSYTDSSYGLGNYQIGTTHQTTTTTSIGMPNARTTTVYTVKTKDYEYDSNTYTTSSIFTSSASISKEMFSIQVDLTTFVSGNYYFDSTDSKKIIYNGPLNDHRFTNKDITVGSIINTNGAGSTYTLYWYDIIQTTCDFYTYTAKGTSYYSRFYGSATNIISKYFNTTSTSYSDTKFSYPVETRERLTKTFTYTAQTTTNITLIN